jgi:hypothetical protein
MYRVCVLKCPIKNSPPIEGYNKGCSIFTDVMVIICFCSKFFMSLMTNNHDIQAILDDNHKGHDKEEYIEMVHYADYFTEQYQMYTIIILLNIFNLMNALRIFRLVHWIMLIIERTFNVIGLFMMGLIPIQIGFSFLSYIFVGPYLEKYAGLLQGIKQQIITMMGQQDSMALLRSNSNFAFAWTMSFIVFFSYFFITSSIVGFENGFDETVHEKGYPSDFEKASQWNIKDYFVWAFSWIPDFYLQKFKKIIDYDNDEEEGDEDAE